MGLFLMEPKMLLMIKAIVESARQRHWYADQPNPP